MKNSHIANSFQHGTRIEIDKRIAYHKAGHAAAIYLGNKQKQLPAVYFQIIIKQQERARREADRFPYTHGKYTAKVEGGRLIQSLPFSFSEATRDFSWSQQEEYRCALEADVINLLAGSMAEAKYLASSDYGVFNGNLINLSALRFYGGSSDIKVISEYMECFIPHKAERDRKLIELFLAALSFVNKSSNWRAISDLAEFILNEPKEIIHCEEVIAFLDNRFVEVPGHYSTLLPGYF
jgi:hypothetical protein